MIGKESRYEGCKKPFTSVWLLQSDRFVFAALERRDGKHGLSCYPFDIGVARQGFDIGIVRYRGSPVARLLFARATCRDQDR